MRRRLEPIILWLVVVCIIFCAILAWQIGHALKWHG